MRKNVLLKIAAAVCIFLSAVLVLSILYASFVLVHWHIDPQYYADVLLNDDRPVGWMGFKSQTVWTTEDTFPETPFALSNLKPISMYLIYLQGTVLCVTTLLALQEFLKIINSVKKIETFRFRNIISFRKIGHYFLIIFLLTSFKVVFVNQGELYRFSLHIEFLLIIVAAYILAEVFKEGNNLLEEGKLTI